MIEIEHLSFTYNAATESALSDVNLKISDGEFVLITGPSGSGKSSLVRCLNGLIPHFHGGRITGHIEVEGLNPIDQSPSRLATHVGMVFQDPENQLISMDVEREIAFPMENLAFHHNLIARRIEESLDTMGIASLRYRPIHSLSGGEKQKVAIASVLALHPNVLVLDEPTSGLDPKSAEDVLSMVKRLNDELGITIILIEHRLERVVHLVDRLIIMHNGTVALDGNPRKVVNDRITADLGIGIPPVVELVQKLGKTIDLRGEIPLTVKEARLLLEPIINQKEKSTGFAKLDSNGAKPVIDIHKLWHIYTPEVIALKDINLTVSEGEFVAVMGRNASGKTTLLKHTNGLLQPTRGRVNVNGVDIAGNSVGQMARYIGFSFQNPNDHLFADTVEQEIGFTLKNFNFKKQERQARIENMLEQFHLIKHRGAYPRNLSGGERQRVALASVIASSPKVLVLDEPTRGMEHQLKMELMAFLDNYRQKGNTVILISHDVETVAEHADRVVLLSEGRMVIDCTAREALSNALLFSPQINRLAQFFQRYGLPSDVLTVEEMLRILS